MTEEEIINNFSKLWESVKNDREFSYEIVHEVDRFLNGQITGLDGIKELGTELYREVGRSNYPDGDVRRDGIRSMSHFVMGFWEIKSGRLEESKRRLYIAGAGMNNYFEKWVNA